MYVILKDIHVLQEQGKIFNSKHKSIGPSFF